ncbi:hypothetical protein GXW82_43265 [Streptacidiphilus sp. 4-A2]|nr:hypothetical protein [Streptacidiphilus sp. 4-A2]
MTITSGDVDPWGTAVTRTFDFGDGTPDVTTTAASVRHTYTTLVGGQSTFHVVTETEAGRVYKVGVSINPPGPLVDKITAREENPQAPLTVTVEAGGSDSPFDFSSCKLDFGDGSPVVTQPGYCGDAETPTTGPATTPSAAP